ncbi:hypothetical protein DEU56DRAFT_919609 [Suillus clintonianus]|uniref:uncharacterized protein n=1 Tax=Suillus clintonianus TaxID=1904413 RepID=UPI001B87FF11|nr:uncharacterized protein DEU56DRAFT_919609 [Suillus clintonianus]KAG2114400.1 hypothetical protein DEU56DRAFT_919609 [Suillus clintonianus]
MQPSCKLRHWNAQDINQLVRAKGTIQDVDGECSLRVSGHSRKSYQIAPHYRLPLYSLNKKIGIYRKIVAHLQTLSDIYSSHMLDMYASVMEYLHNVRIAFVQDAGGSTDALHDDLRSPVLDYYLWLDHKSGVFHAQCREALEEEHRVTFEALQNRACSDILFSVDWKSYHQEKCKYYDFCGAIQSSGGGEDDQNLIDIIDASIVASKQKATEITAEPTSAMDVDHELTLIVSEPTSDNLPLNPFPQFPLPFDNDLRRLSLSTLGGYARQILIGGFGQWLPSHIAMRF